MLDIMLPFWGEPRYLYETVEAVLNQTDERWHLTVVDDCYPDPDVPQYFKHLGHPRVVYIRNGKNLGITARLIKSVRGFTGRPRESMGWTPGWMMSACGNFS